MRVGEPAGESKQGIMRRLEAGHPHGDGVCRIALELQLKPPAGRFLADAVDSHLPRLPRGTDRPSVQSFEKPLARRV